MATISNTPRPAYAWDQDTSQWVPIGIGPHSHAQSDITGLTTALAGKSDDLISYVNDSTASRTISSGSDKFKTVVMSYAGAIAVTVPSDSADTGWPVGSYCNVRVTGSGGQVTVSAGSGATIVGADSQFKTRVRYSEIILEKIAANTWLVAGDTAA